MSRWPQASLTSTSCPSSFARPQGYAKALFISCWLPFLKSIFQTEPLFPKVIRSRFHSELGRDLEPEVTTRVFASRYTADVGQMNGALPSVLIFCPPWRPPSMTMPLRSKPTANPDNSSAATQVISWSYVATFSCEPLASSLNNFEPLEKYSASPTATKLSRPGAAMSSSASSRAWFGCNGPSITGTEALYFPLPRNESNAARSVPITTSCPNNFQDRTTPDRRLVSSIYQPGY